MTHITFSPSPLARTVTWLYLPVDFLRTVGLKGRARKVVNTRNIHHGLFNFTLHMKEKMPRSYFDLEVYTFKKKNSVRAALLLNRETQRSLPTVTLCG